MISNSSLLAHLKKKEKKNTKDVSILSISGQKYVINRDFYLKVKITHKPKPRRITVTIPLLFY